MHTHRRSWFFAIVTTGALLTSFVATAPAQAQVCPTNSWALDRLDQLSLPLDGQFCRIPSGAGVNIYIVSTGIQMTHVEFGGRANFLFDFEGGSGVDCVGVGTYQASLAAGTTYGVAPGARLWNVRVVSCAGSMYEHDVILGIERIVSSGPRPGVVLLPGVFCSPGFHGAVNSLLTAGFTVIAPVGTENRENCDPSCPHASIPDVIVVGAIDQNDCRGSFSNYGPCVDVYAPGVEVTAVGGTQTGTHASAALAAGVAAHFLALEPGATPHDVAEAIQTASVEGGCGRLDILTTDFYGSGVLPPPPPPDAPRASDTRFLADESCTIAIDRVIGDKAKMNASGLLSETATLEIMCFGLREHVSPNSEPLRFNGRPMGYMGRSLGHWRLVRREIPIEWVNFPADPGLGGTSTPIANTIEIDSGACDIAWASLKIEAARPVVMVHGAASGSGLGHGLEPVWETWTALLDERGLPNTADLDMGVLDSMRANAGKLADFVDGAKDRWGVDQVVLVCHSKGGLDARHFVEHDDSVSQVIQLGSPNAGSPLADAIQVGIALSAGPWANLAAAWLAPAGYELTVTYMSGYYNPNHGLNPNVRYTALAGDYDVNCDWWNAVCHAVHAVDYFLFAIVGTYSDLIVPVNSVFALPISDEILYETGGSNRGATHFKLQSSTVFSMLYDRISSTAGMSGGGGAIEEPVSEFVDTAPLTGEVVQGVVEEHSLALDESTLTMVSLLHAGADDLDLALISPSGVRFEPGVATDEVVWSDGTVIDMTTEVFSLLAPEAGLWTVEVHGIDVAAPDGAAGYMVRTSILEPTITLEASTPTPHVAIGDPLVLRGALTANGVPLTGAEVNASVALPDGTRMVVPMLDLGLGADQVAGDGVYTGELPGTTDAGYYKIATVAEGDGVGGPFSRSAFSVATVSASSSRIVGFNDQGRDTDGDGLYDELVVNALVSATAPAEYRVRAVLADTAGHELSAAAVQTLGAGPQTVELVFDGNAIYDHGIDGPYTIVSATLAEDGELGLLPVEELIDPHLTDPYAFAEFEHPSVQIDTSASSVGVDSDQDGLFDQLRVRVPVAVHTTGSYHWSGCLFDHQGMEIGFAAGSGALQSSPPDSSQWITLEFSGPPINANGVDGPYQVGNTIVFGPGGTGMVDEVGWTEAYTAMQFEGACGSGGNCDAPHNTPGCIDPACCAIVCALDPYCCEVVWDEYCAAEAAACLPPCPADFDGSGEVGFSDLTHVLSVWGPCGLSCPEDLDVSGDVGFSDLTTLLANWGSCGSATPRDGSLD